MRPSSTDGSDPEPLPTGSEKTIRVRAMFDAVAPRYDLVNRIITLGLDQRWRRTTIDALGLPTGSRIGDVGCGTGDLCRIARSSGHRAVGLDLSWGMLTAGRSGAPLVQADAERLPVTTGALDGMVSGYALRNFTDLRAVFDEFGRIVRPGGRISLLEVAAPRSRVMERGFSLWFDRAVPAIGGLLSDRAAYRYLPRSTVYLPSTAELRGMLLAAGFSTVGHRLLSGGLSQLYTATRTGLPKR